MLRYLLFFCFFLLSFASNAQSQSIVFVNPETNKTIQVPKGSVLMVEYKGYLQQLELEMNNLFVVNDSSIVLGKYHLIGKHSDMRTIKLDDITGFRKVSVGSQLLKTLFVFGATLGSYYAFSDNDNLNSTQQLALSLGTGLVTTSLIKIIFPSNKVKHKMKEGWKIVVL